LPSPVGRAVRRAGDDPARGGIRPEASAGGTRARDRVLLVGPPQPLGRCPAPGRVPALLRSAGHGLLQVVLLRCEGRRTGTTKPSSMAMARPMLISAWRRMPPSFHDACWARVAAQENNRTRVG